MKLPLLESSIIKLEIGGAALGGIFGIITQDQYLSTAGWGILGAILGGFVGAYLFRAKDLKDWLLRWLVNIAAGIFTGLVITSKFENSNPDIPLPFLAMFCSAIAGPLTVLILPVGLPIIKDFIIAWLKQILQRNQK